MWGFDMQLLEGRELFLTHSYSLHSAWHTVNINIKVSWLDLDRVSESNISQGFGCEREVLKDE